VTVTRLEIVIDELVLHGFAPGDRHAIGEALEGELLRLGAAADLRSLAQLGSLPELPAVDVNLQPGARSAAVGAQVARAVHAGLGSRRPEAPR
jgi:hypothetical protein